MIAPGGIARRGDDSREQLILSATNSTANPCTTCGACCAYSSNWPRFTIEDDAALDLIPLSYVNDRLSGMRCEGDRCSALKGRIGGTTACGIYEVRPEVCRVCLPGDDECTMARRKFGLARIDVQQSGQAAG